MLKTPGHARNGAFVNRGSQQRALSTKSQGALLQSFQLSRAGLDAIFAERKGTGDKMSEPQTLNDSCLARMH